MKTRVISLYGGGIEVLVSKDGDIIEAHMLAPTPYENWTDAMPLILSSPRIKQDIVEEFEKIDDWEWCSLTHEHDYMTGT
jgi:hypothetical protein